MSRTIQSILVLCLSSSLLLRVAGGQPTSPLDDRGPNDSDWPLSTASVPLTPYLPPQPSTAVLLSPPVISSESSRLIAEGKKFERGDGVTKNIDRAVGLYTSALKEGNTYAGICLWGLASDLSIDRGMTKNCAKAKAIFEIYRKEFENGHYESDKWAALSLAASYSDGVGTPIQPRKAVVWYLRYVAADTDSLRENKDYCKAIAADLARIGDNLRLKPTNPDDMKLALGVLRKAADLGDVEACFSLGLVLEEGKACEKNTQEAAAYFTKTAEAGVIEAQRELSRIYCQADSALYDCVKALMWADIAGASVSKDSVQTRDSLEEHMLPEQIVQARTLAREFIEEHKESASSGSAAISAQEDLQ